MALRFTNESSAPAGVTGKQTVYSDGGVIKSVDVGGTVTNLSPLVGEVRMYAGTSAPTGWLVLDGATISQSTYAALFALVAHTYGSDPGGGNFILPDMRGRMPIGVGTGAGLTARTLADEGGAESTTDVPAHSHSLGDNCVDDDAGAFSPVGNYLAEDGDNAQYSTEDPDETMGLTDTESTGIAAVDLMNPFLALNFIIKT